MFKYACLNPIAKVGLDKFTDNYAKTDDIDAADGILVRSAKINEIPKNAIAIARAGAGVNNIPVEECAKQGVVVFNSPGANANGVKELVIAAMLICARDVVGGVKWVRENQTDPEIEAKAEKAKKQFAGSEILGKKLGVIGLGAVGQLVANAAVDLGMDVYGYDPYLSVDAAWKVSGAVHHVRNVSDIYKSCDYITIHVPLLDSTRGMVDAEAIAMMKKNAVVLNFARDLIVDEVAMAEALRAGKVRKYASDFANPTICAAPNTITTPHLGASTAEAEDNCAIMSVMELMDYLENGNIRNSVNYPACSAGPLETGARICICHRNVVNQINEFTSVISGAGMNIANFTNKSRGEYAYSLIDLESEPSDDIIEKLEGVEGVSRVRVLVK